MLYTGKSSQRAFRVGLVETNIIWTFVLMGGKKVQLTSAVLYDSYNTADSSTYNIVADISALQ